MAVGPDVVTVTDQPAAQWEYRIRWTDTRGIPRELIKTPTRSATEAVLRIRRTNGSDFPIVIAKRRRGDADFRLSGWSDMTRRLRHDYFAALRTQPGWIEPYGLARR